MLPKYGDWRPTAFDPRGAFLEDRQDWLVAPVLRTRDSDALTQSNFETALKLMGGEGDDVEVHGFNHWGPGWFEIIIVKPDSQAALAAEEIMLRLENYPILDEDDLGRRELEERWQWWDNADVRERAELLQEARERGAKVSIFAARRSEMPTAALDALERKGM